MKKINQFSGIEFPEIDLASFGHNSSLSKNTSDSQPKRITGLEAKLCYLVTKQELYKLGYDDFSSQKIEVLDFFNLLMTTLRNSIYYFRQIVFSRNVRKRVFKFVNQATLQTGH